LLVEFLDFGDDQFGRAEAGRFSNVIEMGIEHPDFFVGETVVQVRVGADARQGGVPAFGRQVGRFRQPERTRFEQPETRFAKIQGRVFAGLFSIVAAAAYTLESRELLDQVFHLPVQAFLDPEYVGFVEAQLRRQVVAAQGPGVRAVGRIVETDVVGERYQGRLGVGG
jgi:hypothetical protein